MNIYENNYTQHNYTYKYSNMHNTNIIIIYGQLLQLGI